MLGVPSEEAFHNEHYFRWGKQWHYGGNPYVGTVSPGAARLCHSTPMEFHMPVLVYALDINLNEVATWTIVESYGVGMATEIRKLGPPIVVAAPGVFHIELTDRPWFITPGLHWLQARTSVASIAFAYGANLVTSMTGDCPWAQWSTTFWELTKDNNGRPIAVRMRYKVPEDRWW